MSDPTLSNGLITIIDNLNQSTIFGNSSLYNYSFGIALDKNGNLFTSCIDSSSIIKTLIHMI